MSEPAIKSYFFGKGYTDLKNVIKDSWSRNISSAGNYFSKIDTTGESWEVLGSIAFFGSTGVSIFLFGTIIFFLISIVHITILAILFLWIYISFSIVYLMERIFLFFKQFFVACPSCHEKTPLPEYLCPNCKIAHQSLIPNRYGTFRHRCQCGEKLPATFFLNRGKLQTRCPECHQLLNRKHTESKGIFIPVLGGASAGKSAFVFSAIRELINKEATKYGFETAFIDSATESEYNLIERKLQAGYAPSKTVDIVPKAFNLALNKNKKTKWLLYLYDPAGEAFENIDALPLHQYLEYSNGMILIIDPFSITSVKNKYNHRLKHSTINPSKLQSSDTLARVLLIMEEIFGLSSTDKIEKPMAVVLTKIDAFDLNKYIGKKAIGKAQEDEPDLDYATIRNKVIKQQLADWGETELLQQLEVRFKKVAFFSCSSLTRKSSHIGSSYISQHVFEPVLWILQSVASKTFKKK